MGLVDRMMNVPLLYSMVQKGVAGKLHDSVLAQIRDEIPDTSGSAVLDVGCGPGSYSAYFKHSTYLGMDINEGYIAKARKTFSAPNREFVVGDATEVRVGGRMFDSIFSVGLYHHLDDAATVKSISGLRKLVKKDGKIAVFDAVYPENRLNVPGYLVRRMDRGRFVRRCEDYERLLRGNLGLRRFEYVCCGLLDYVYYEL